LESSRDFRGNSSKKMTTTGGCLPPVTAAGAALAEASALAGRTSLETGDSSRKTRAKTSGAGARYRSHSRSHDVRAYRAAASAPTARATTTTAGPRRPVSFLATWMASRANSPATAARCSQRRTVSETSPTATSKPQMKKAGRTITPSTRTTMSSRSARRNRKKSGLLPVTSSSGWAMAKPLSTNSSTSAHRCSRSRHPRPRPSPDPSGAGPPGAVPASSISLATAYPLSSR
jgi:hypothetical protein